MRDNQKRDTRLDQREIEILDLLAKGLTTNRIAGELHVSDKWVEALRKRIREKLDVRSNYEAVECARKLNLLNPERENVEAIRQHWDSIDLHDPEEFVASLTNDCVWVSDTLPEAARGHQAIKQYVQMYFDAFPDLVIMTESMSCGGNEGSVFWIAEGTHSGKFLGIPPSGRRGRVSACTHVKFEDGKISFMRDYWDMNSLLEQIGEVRLQKAPSA